MLDHFEQDNDIVGLVLQLLDRGRELYAVASRGDASAVLV